MPDKKVTTRDLLAIKTKRKLFQNAAKLIDKHGYDSVTISDICKKTGVSVGTFYHYYDSKTDIIVEFFKQIDYYYKENVEPQMKGKAAADIDTYFYYYAKFHVDQGYGHTSMILRMQSDFFQDKTRYMYVLLLKLVNDAKTNGDFNKNANPAVIADYLLVVARGLLFDWALAHGEHDLIAKMGTYINLAKDSFK